MEITGDISKTLIKEYLRNHSKNMLRSLEKAEDDPKMLAAIVTEAISKGLRPSKRGRRTGLEYYDKYIKPANMSLPRIRNTKRHTKNKTMNMREDGSSDGSSEDVEEATVKPKTQKKLLNTLELPWLFPKMDPVKERQEESTIRKIVQRRKKAKGLNRTSSKSSVTSFHSCFFNTLDNPA